MQKELNRLKELWLLWFDVRRTIPFKKMYGLGNDFIVLDARKDASVKAGPTSAST